MSIVLALAAALFTVPQEPVVAPFDDPLLGSTAALSSVFRAQQTIAPTLGNALVGRAGGRTLNTDPAQGAMSDPRGVHVTAVEARATIREWVARTELRFTLTNPWHHDVPTDFVVPLPEGAAVSHIAYTGVANEAPIEILPAAQARLEYDALVAHAIDPALLEFVGWNAVRTSVFPVPPGAGFQVVLTYEHALEPDSTGALCYTLPRSTLLARDVPITLEAHVLTWDWQRGVDLYSPTHPLEMEPSPISSIPGRIVRVSEAGRTAPGSVELFFRRLDPRGGAGLFAFTDAGGQRYGLLRFTPGSEFATSGLDRRIVLVLDRSGSMRGEKFEQARAGAIAIVQGLEDGETLNIVDYSDTVSLAWAEPRVIDDVTRAEAVAHLERLEVGGGTNLHEALRVALEQATPPLVEERTVRPWTASSAMIPIDVLPLVLALTDGLPTVGETSEHAIRSLVSDANTAGRPRLFALGVGYDVNAPLLDGLASASRASSHYVRPGQNTERAMTEVFADLRGPILTDIEIEATAADGSPAPQAFCDVHPARMPDLFAGDALTVAGRLNTRAGIKLRVTGRTGQGPVAFDFAFEEEALRRQFSFVPRLWATRRIAHLTELARALGSGGAGSGGTANGEVSAAALTELSEEILRLSLRHGVLSEYSSFLVHEGTDLGQWGTLVAANGVQIYENAVAPRSGVGQVSQGMNWNSRASADYQNLSNDMVGFDGVQVQYAALQALDDRAFVRTAGWFDADGAPCDPPPADWPQSLEEEEHFLASATYATRWVDGRLLEQDLPEPARVVDRWSPEFVALVKQLHAQGNLTCLALDGQVLVELGGEAVLVR